MSESIEDFIGPLSPSELELAKKALGEGTYACMRTCLEANPIRPRDDGIYSPGDKE